MINAAEDILKKYWGFSVFRPSQKKVIQSVLNGDNTLALLPTGGGKSICFQVPGLLHPGICIVVSPLVALVQDQIQALKSKGIKAIGLTGGIPTQEVDILLDNCIHGNYKFLYLSPERLQHPLVQERILKMPVNLIAIDEAHCISEWGHDFRPAYRKCNLLKELHPNVPIIALTATATKKVVSDILDNLNIVNATVHRESFRRENIEFHVIQKEDKVYEVKQLLKNNSKSGIVYVRSRKNAVMLSQQLNDGGKSATYFHGGLSSEEKKQRLNAWLKNHYKIMVATNAFGMGVDKPDVSTVIHFQLPDSIENYYQEAGRAGRDGKPARAILFANNNDIERAKSQFLDVLPDTSFVKTVYKKLNTYLQIAYNEGEQKYYAISLKTFCAQYNLNISKTYSSLKLLDQNGILSLLEKGTDTTTILLKVSKNQIFSWIENHPKEGEVLKTMLRTYGGVFDFETKINLTLLSKKNGTSITTINSAFQKLVKDGFAEYKNEHHDLGILFLKPREDDNTINPIARNIKKLNMSKKDKMQSMFLYATNHKKCRTQLLLAYFGQGQYELCGKCDVCLKKHNKINDNRILKHQIIALLHKEQKTSRELSHIYPDQESKLLMVLKELLEDGHIELKTNNAYGIK